MGSSFEDSPLFPRSCVGTRKTRSFTENCKQQVRAALRMRVGLLIIQCNSVKIRGELLQFKLFNFQP